VGVKLDSRVVFPYPLQEGHRTVDIAGSDPLLTFFKHTGMEGPIGTRTLVGKVSPYELVPFVQGQVPPDPLAHLASQVGSMHLPNANGLVMAARRQPLAIRTERYREDRTVAATQNHRRSLELVQVPEPYYATETSRSQPLIIGAKGDTINGHSISR